MKIQFDIQFSGKLDWEKVPNFVSQIDQKKMTYAQIEAEFIKYMEHWYNDEPDMESIGKWIKNAIRNSPTRPKFKLGRLTE